MSSRGNMPGLGAWCRGVARKFMGPLRGPLQCNIYSPSSVALSLPFITSGASCQLLWPSITTDDISYSMLPAYLFISWEQPATCSLSKTLLSVSAALTDIILIPRLPACLSDCCLSAVSAFIFFFFGSYGQANVLIQAVSVFKSHISNAEFHICWLCQLLLTSVWC